ncbi:uncharacterized protein [Watersipora subatra]|uniref:uncharacterized protein n=1 Tax=Watersipora subatra TaxID=2589382 RepID=UPI00355B1CFD
MAAARADVVEQLRDNLVCYICIERKELRLLPCQNTVCFSCLETIVATATRKRELPKCPYCRNELTLSPSDYPLCRLAADFEREFDRLEAAIKECSLHDEVPCETTGCTRPIDWYCEGCQGFICTRCSRRNSCTRSESSHTLTDFEKLKEESCRLFEEWKKVKNAEIDSLTTARTQMASEMRHEIAGASDDTVADVFAKHEQMKTSHKILSLKSLEVGEKAVLDYYTAGITKVSDTEYIRLVWQMTAALKSDNTPTIESCTVIMDKPCYSVTETSKGQLAVGRNGGFDILDSEGKFIRAVEVYNINIHSVQEYDGNMYTLCREPLSSKRHVIVFSSSSYQEIKRWPVPDCNHISQLAVGNNMVYVSDSENRRLSVYPVDYRYSKFFLRNQTPIYTTHNSFSTPDYLASCPEDSIAISDWKASKVQLRCLNDDTVTWTSSAVSEPIGICSGARQDIWVWSDSSKSLIRLSAYTGKMKGEIIHREFADKDTLIDMCIRSDGRVLWGATRAHEQIVGGILCLKSSVKQLLENIIQQVKKVTNANLWQNTNSVLQRFDNNNKSTTSYKSNHSFIMFDVVEFYPSITKELLLTALHYASEYIKISPDEMNIILQAKFSILVHNNDAWYKKGISTFDVTMGSHDGAETCEIVGLFLLNQIKKQFEGNYRLYRDDGFGIISGTTREIDNTKIKAM